MNKAPSIEFLAAIAKAKGNQKGRKILMTPTEVSTIRQLRQRGISYKAIYETLKQENLTNYSSMMGWRNAWEHRSKVA